ncbi:PREDICTED: zinc finger protein 512B [Nanorana parkeri]|uniref:zinc finger protein 512B n=1 Tax=Nanorana parkeri TaxID=125878 RepID=UPI0008549F21|nr:PREDICTED: zinc finger protein 512B [Nanorana parkeri]
MADSLATGSRRQFPRISKSRASTQLQVLACDSGIYYNKRAVQGKYARDGIQELQGIPASLISEWKEMFKTSPRVKCPSSGCWLEFPSVYGLKQHYQRCQGAALLSRMVVSCPHCEAVFASKPQLQKHLNWNHSEKEDSQESRASPPSLPSRAKEREVKRRPSTHRRSNQTIALSPEENGGMAHAKGRAKKGDACLSDEDPERMRHRRKQKTPKKFTGEQPSITTTFGLKGLGKAEDKSRARHSKFGRIGETKTNSGRIGETKKRQETSCIRLENVTAAPSGSVDDNFHRQTNKRGEVTCPNCGSVTRKTVAGLRKHMDVCEQLQEALRCQHCRKQFKSKAGLNYHTMAEHVNKSSSTNKVPVNDPRERERLRKVLKQMGKLRCPKENCMASFSSLMGYQYHTQRCGREQCDREKLHFSCPHCSKAYRSKAGRDYHVRSEHCTDLTSPEEPEPTSKQEVEIEDFERTPSGRVRRRSAQVAVFHLQEIAEDELAKEGSRKRMKEDLVPDSKRLNYLRPGLPTFNPQLLDTWKNSVKDNGFICCPNNCCEAIYSSVSGLKAHLANCNKGEHSVGKYRCLLCQKEFSSESGVKYHIVKTHSQNWFRVSAVSAAITRKRKQNFSSNKSAMEAIGKKKKRKIQEESPVGSPPSAASPDAETPLALNTHPNKATGGDNAHAHNAPPVVKNQKAAPIKRGK